PYETPDGHCPHCGGGTVITQDAPTNTERLCVRGAKFREPASEPLVSSEDAEALRRIWEFEPKDKAA
ncbi:MAG: hypothetical protein LC798_20795, partial [Chloroflexi bacterium]|nr:hypothetical protein [Chloroflexota bacterium]